MWDLLGLAWSPAFVVGVVLGFLVAVGFHQVAPVDVDTVAAGAWFVALGGVAGLLWEFLFSVRKK